jgi:hypothetical protein
MSDPNELYQLTRIANSFDKIAMAMSCISVWIFLIGLNLALGNININFTGKKGE